MSPTGSSRGRLIRVATVAVIVVLTVLGWLLVDGSGSSAPDAGPAPTAGARPTSGSSTADPSTADPSRSTDPETGLAWVDLAGLPAQARTTVRLIDAGGPFPYAKDGVVFGNRERLLPRRPSGYYHEYTVPTPGSGDRGARRVVAGDGTRQLFYTDDHYASFRRIRR